jgi:hypothetical protein
MFSIGEFSRIPRLTVTTIRLFHEKESLVPKRGDEATGYRYFDGQNIEWPRPKPKVRHCSPKRFLPPVRFYLFSRFRNDPTLTAKISG